MYRNCFIEKQDLHTKPEDFIHEIYRFNNNNNQKRSK